MVLVLTLALILTLMLIVILTLILRSVVPLREGGIVKGTTTSTCLRGRVNPRRGGREFSQADGGVLGERGEGGGAPLISRQQIRPNVLKNIMRRGTFLVGGVFVESIVLFLIIFTIRVHEFLVVVLVLGDKTEEMATEELGEGSDGIVHWILLHG